MGADKDEYEDKLEKMGAKGPEDGFEGPVRPFDNRGCTDILCCIFFILFWIGFVIVTITGFTTGNPELIGRGYDVSGKICGIDEGYEDFPLLYFPVPRSGSFDKGLCVSECPPVDPQFPDGQQIDSNYELDCKEPVDNSEYDNCAWSSTNIATIAQRLRDDTDSQLFGANFGYPTSSFLSRYCLPSAVLDSGVFGDATSQVMNNDRVQEWMSDLRTTWGIILATVGIAFVLGFVYMYFLKFCAGIMIWVSIIGIFAVCCVFGALYYTGADSTSDLANAYSSSSDDDTSSVDDSSTSQKALGIFLWAIAAIILIMVCCLYTRIKLAIAIIKTAADYVTDTPTVFLVPPVMLLVLLAFYAYWGISAIYLASSGESEQIEGSAVGSFNYNETQQRLLIYSIFALLWGNAFILACQQFIIASSTVIWYFTDEARNESTIRVSVKRLFRYHLGSIAFGSFILAVVQFIRLCLAYIENKLKQSGQSDKKLVKYLIKCCQCYMRCFERFIKFLNKNAYIMIAIKGKNFCASAKDAFFLILRNPCRFGVTASIGNIFVVFGKLLVAGSATFIGYLIITKADSYKDKIYSPIFPTIIMFAGTWLMASVFLNIYDLACDAILASFVVSEEVHKKKGGAIIIKPRLREFLDGLPAKFDNRKKE